MVEPTQDGHGHRLTDGLNVDRLNTDTFRIVLDLEFAPDNLLEDDHFARHMDRPISVRELAVTALRFARKVGRRRRPAR